MIPQEPCIVYISHCDGCFCDDLMVYGGRESETTAVEAVLKEAGLTVSKTCCSRPSCFDFAARKGDKVILIKVQPDIDNLSLKDSQELKALSECFSASSILLGGKTRENPLEDDTIYSRYDLLVFTPKTLENILLRKTYPLIQASPGGYYVEIDAETIKRRRQELGASVGEMAKMIGISRRTLYGYERGLAKASVTIAYNLISTLGVPVAKPVDIFEKSERQRKCRILTTAKRVIANNSLLQKILRKLSRYRVTAVKKAPFDFVISVPEDKMCIIGGVARDGESTLDKRVDEIISVSKIVQAHSILITEGQEPSNKDITCIRSEAFSKIIDLKEFFSNNI